MTVVVWFDFAPQAGACTERSAAHSGAKSKWTRAESNRRPGLIQRPLSYARSRPFISAYGLQSTGFRRPSRR